MQQIQFVQVTPEQLQNAIIEGVKTQLQDLKKHFEPKSPNVYLTRLEVAEMLKINISSVHNWTKKGVLTAYQISGRVYYLRDEVEKAIVKLEN
ncbi:MULTISPECIES: helix-turn-helix domain-containing protein [unclassified Cellulophaga]|uniref:helix-turn-helix domain-containing protein n=1 Tax=unclassified Cellulophaga TaxID=2634405 RepID=UPI0026E1C0B8|nr:MULTISPECIES: helix-turn-helix domain-containing protein [unclassified Cellulophaga]MDO6491776.1 helix-turn-helix domain-containing protein [Cellulophaga sp. 2_MG-2023]MDO6495569.1 helix-turn-helix domain-containing protein [Cellulophaga sp. 3_MG-2023]